MTRATKSSAADGASHDEVLAYLHDVGGYAPSVAAKRLEFIEHPLWRTYVFCYAGGEQTQAECDTQFRQDMNALCVAQHPAALDPLRYVCLTFAQLYYAGVRFFGQFFI